MIPKIVFIVPYRNRPQHKFFFTHYLTTNIMKDKNPTDYEIYFSHQDDTRVFNRGAIKNIGFLAVKNKYLEKELYKDITFVFNDIDTIPFTDLFNYETKHNQVKHFYGYEYALGGIVAIKGADFEKINGFPNYWGWGMEDNVLQKRCEKHQIIIDRSVFYPIGHPNMIQLFDGITRIINRKDPWRANNDNGFDGLRTIHQLTYSIDKTSTNPLDNIHKQLINNLFVINVTEFLTAVPFEKNSCVKYDLREPSRKIIHPSSRLLNQQSNNIDVKDDNINWTNIPNYPTQQKRQELNQIYGEKRANEIIHQVYNQTQQKEQKQQKEQTQEQQTQEQEQQTQQTQQTQNNIHNKTMTKLDEYTKKYKQIMESKTIVKNRVNIRLGGIR